MTRKDFLVLIAPFLPAIIGVSGTAIGAQPKDSGQAGSLTVTVSGLHSAQGQLIACLWRDATKFPTCQKSATARRIVVPVRGTTMQVQFPGVAPGDYAVTVQHDENADGKMGHNFIGMPTEGVGSSNNPGGMPNFGKAKFHAEGDTAIAVTMRYLFG